VSSGDETIASSPQEIEENQQHAVASPGKEKYCHPQTLGLKVETSSAKKIEKKFCHPKPLLV